MDLEDIEDFETVIAGAGGQQEGLQYNGEAEW